jgi:hypothetical protein
MMNYQKTNKQALIEDHKRLMAEASKTYQQMRILFGLLSAAVAVALIK